MERQVFSGLLTKYLKGNATAEEQSLLEEYYKRLDETSALNLSEEQEEAMRHLLYEKIRFQIAGNKIRRFPYRRTAVAASVLICCGLAYYFFKPSKQKPAFQTAKSIIQPGSNKAILTLAGGRQIDLNDATNGQLAEEAGIRITKDKNGQITYVAGQTGSEVHYNTTTTPKGGQWHLVLQDGTGVWLNAASSLRYPTAFTGAERKVELTGEGYFEVAKDKAHPFIVSTAKETVTVLGTHFNINTYADEPSVKTTLLEGSVKVNSTVIRPGEQAILHEAGMDVKQTDVDEAVAWKNGLFVFEQEDLQSVMRKLARWYDVDIVYQESIDHITFTGTIGRFDDISKILHKITFTSGVHFKAEGRRITVSK